MIDFKEIRVGNIVYFNLNKQGSNNTTCIVRRIDYGVWLNGIGSYLNTRFSLNDSDDTFGMPENYNPIQISEDLLFKLGFKIEHNDITKVKYYRLRPMAFV